MLGGYPMTVSMNLGLRELWCYVCICLVGMTSHPAMSRALQIGPPTKATSIFMTNMVLSGVIGVVALHEAVTWFSLVGATVIITSVVLVIVQGPKHPNKYEALPTCGVQEVEM